MPLRIDGTLPSREFCPVVEVQQIPQAAVAAEKDVEGVVLKRSCRPQAMEPKKNSNRPSRWPRVLMIPSQIKKLLRH